VLRNLTSLAVAALEYIFLQVSVNRVALVALFGMLGGAVLYGAHDVMVSSQGYLWLLFNIVATSAYQVGWRPLCWSHSQCSRLQMLTAALRALTFFLRFSSRKW
jgi:hypothetical protein